MGSARRVVFLGMCLVWSGVAGLLGCEGDGSLDVSVEERVAIPGDRVRWRRPGEAMGPVQREGDAATLPPMEAPAVWRPLSDPPPARPRLFPTVTATPTGVLLFGGVVGRFPLADPWRWDGQRWYPVAAQGAPAGRTAHLAAATPAGACIWGGRGPSGLLDDGACWDAARDRWEPTPRAGAPSPRADAMGAWDGRALVLFGGIDREGESLGDAYGLVPGAEGWAALPEGPRARHRGLLAPATGRLGRVDEGLVLVGGAGEALALGAEDAARWTPNPGRWTDLDREGVPSASEGPVYLATESGPVVLGESAAARFDRLSGRWEPLPTEAMPPLRLGASALAVPGALIVWGGRDIHGDQGSGAVYDAATRRWIALPPGPPPRRDAVLLESGGRVLLLWGQDDGGLRDDAWELDLEALRSAEPRP